VAAGLVTLSLLVGLFVLLRPYLMRAPAANPDLQQMRGRIEAGRLALTQGRFQKASDELRGAWQQAKDKPEGLSAAELRELTQLYRQADLLAGLLSQSLQEMLEQAQASEADEWQARFRKEYEGKSILFDTSARLDARDTPDLSFKTVQVGEVQARLALDRIRLLSQLPLGFQARRLVFGARLSAFGREAGGRWVIEFHPDSGVLLTDPDAFRACAPTLVDRDPEVLTLLRTQKEWSAGK
jgi:hypothetical protein